VDVHVALKPADGDTGLVAFRLTNQGTRPLGFNVLVDVYGRGRDGQVISSLAPGATKEGVFLVRGISRLQDMPIRFGLREVEGRRIYNRYLRFASKKGTFYEIVP